MRFCTRCGAPVSGILRYCTRCGMPIGEKVHSAAQFNTAQFNTADAGPTQASTPQASTPQASTAQASTAQASTAQTSMGDIAADQASTDAVGAAPDSAAPDATDDAEPDRVLRIGAGWLPGFDEIDDVPPDDPGLPELPPSAARPAAGRRGSRVAVVAAAGALILGAAAWLASNSHPATDARHLATAASRPSPAKPAQRSGHPTASPSARSPRPSATATASSGASSRATRYGLVAISPTLARHARAAQIAAFLDSYFTAVNHRDYREYSSLFERRRRLTAGQFQRGYRSTHDSGAALVSLSNQNQGLAATVTFQSHQAPVSSPDHARCNNWRITLYLQRIGAVYLVAPPPPGYHAVYRDCR